MKKKIILCILALGMLTGCGNAPKLSNGNEAILEFKDGSKISVDDVWKDVKDQYGLSVLLNKMDDKILREEYKDKLDDMEKYIKNYETSLKTNYVDEKGNFDEEKLNSTLTQYGYPSLDVLLDQQRLSYLSDLAVTDYAKKQITDKQVKKYYDDEAVGDIHCVHILVAPEAAGTEKENEALEKAKGIINNINNDIKNGTSAEEAFKKYESDDSVTYQDLDYFNKGDMVEAFEKAAYALGKGKYSSTPVKTSYGYHIILKLDEKEKDTLENLTDNIKEKLAKELIEKDANVSVNALVELRKSYGVKFHDDTLEEQYNRYINNMINSNNSTKNNNKNYALNT